MAILPFGGNRSMEHENYLGDIMRDSQLAQTFVENLDLSEQAPQTDAESDNSSTDSDTRKRVTLIRKACAEFVNKLSQLQIEDEYVSHIIDECKRIVEESVIEVCDRLESRAEAQMSECNVEEEYPEEAGAESYIIDDLQKEEGPPME